MHERHGLSDIERFALALFLVVILGSTAWATGTLLPSLQGEWHGTIDIPGQPLGVIVHLDIDQDGTISATADIPAQGAHGLALQVTSSPDGITFTFVDIPAAIQGNFSEDETRFAGTFHQAGLAFPFTAERRVVAAAQPDETILESLRSIAERALEELSVPGMALAVVKDGQVIMAEGFGLRDVEQGLPVTSNTLFGIGSSTKAFTTTAFQMLVDEGKLSWDQPVRTVIPELRLHDPMVAAQITPLDFALHRSGLPRHDFIWAYNSNLDLAHLITVADHLTPSAGFRTTFQYNNFGYMILGHMIERASGMPWEVFVKSRILDPLGMDSTTFTIQAMEASGDYALAYQEVNGEYVALPQRELGAAGPAGAINTNAADIAKWLLFQLNQGRVGDTQLVSPFDLQFLHTPQMVVPGMDDKEVFLTSYGLGWFIDSYRGHVRVHHGGNTLGYSADVAFIPEKGIGVAVLANDPITPLPGLVVNHVLDELLGLEPIDWIGRLRGVIEAYQNIPQADVSDAGRRLGTSPSHELEEYAGLYENPAYGQVVISLVDGRLEATYYDATIPLEHWHFDQFQGTLENYPIGIPLFFDTGASGDISQLRIGLEPTVDPIVFVRKADEGLLSEAYLSQFVGDYTYAGAVFQVTLSDGVLRLIVPGQPAYVLEPTRPLQFVFRDYQGFAVHFDVDDDGTVTRALLIQPQGNVELIRE